jgi:hypothetical protein
MTDATKLLLDRFAVIPDGEKVAASFTDGIGSRRPDEAGFLLTPGTALVLSVI